MFRFFALPDYSFSELKIPKWCFNKRRSPLFVRPGAEVCSHQEIKSDTAYGSELSGAGGGSGLEMPGGDDDEQELLDVCIDSVPNPRRSQEKRLAQILKGDTGATDLEQQQL